MVHTWSDSSQCNQVVVKHVLVGGDIKNEMINNNMLIERNKSDKEK